jgi:hypothetical protein
MQMLFDPEAVGKLVFRDDTGELKCKDIDAFRYMMTSTETDVGVKYGFCSAWAKNPWLRWSMPRIQQGARW